jgi:RimJ/RimL family protein N-acetyltransferase
MDAEDGLSMEREELQSRLPIGSLVNPGHAKPPERNMTLRGQHVTIAPFDPVSHAEALWQETGGPERDRLWLYLWEGPFRDRASFDADLRRKAESADPLYYAILDNASGEAVGHAAYLRMVPQHRVIEVGSIIYTPRLQRTVGATEAMYLMARHAFEDLGNRRYEWKCHALNAVSHAAALRLGFTYEGTFRQHMIIKGRNRDTAWFSMLDSEWPRCKAAFEQWLAPENFDDQGKQRQSLAEMRKGWNHWE